jgi:hypothetical protein
VHDRGGHATQGADCFFVGAKPNSTLAGPGPASKQHLHCRGVCRLSGGKALLVLALRQHARILYGLLGGALCRRGGLHVVLLLHLLQLAQLSHPLLLSCPLQLIQAPARL